MKKRTKPLAFLTALCLSFSLFVFSLPASAAGVGPGNTSVEAPSASTGGTVYIGTLTYNSGIDSVYTGPDYESEYFAYIPNCTEYGERSTASPILLVYGDTAYTAESALQTALDYGLAEIADAERAPLIFINPSDSEAGWTAADAIGMIAAKNMFSDTTNSTYDAGEGKSSDGVYPGFYGRLIVFAEGNGADFAYSQLAPGVLAKGQYFSSGYWKPTSLFLMNPTSTEPTDLAVNTGRNLPVYIVNGSESIVDAFTELNNGGVTVFTTSTTTEGFGSTEVCGAYNSILEHWFLRDMGGVHSLLTIDDFSQTGIVKSRSDFSLGSVQSITYYSYVPSSVKDAAAGTVPLFVIFHGGGNHAENIVFSSGIDKLAASDGFMVMSVQDHRNYTSSETVAAIEDFITTNPQTDRSRIYAGGFSIGSAKSALLVSDTGSYFAGIVHMNGITTVPTVEGTPVAMPVFLIGGAQSHLAEFPTEAAHGLVSYYFGANGVDDSFVFDPAYTWGKEPTEQIVTAATDIVEPPLSLTTSYFQSKDGNTYTAFASAATAGHEPTLVATTEAWNFIKQFSRNTDGSISVEGAASLALSVDKRFVSSGEYFEVAAAMDPAVNSNAATLTIRYDAEKFVYHKFEAAAGITVISADNDTAKGEVTITLGNMEGYGFTDIGAALFQAREDVQLANEKLPINASISYVLLENGDKFIRGAVGTAKIGTRGLLGDTNNDGVVDLIDLSNMIDWFGLAEDDADWEQIEYFDFNENGKIEISDIAMVASLIK